MVARLDEQRAQIVDRRIGVIDEVGALLGVDGQIVQRSRRYLAAAVLSYGGG